MDLERIKARIQKFATDRDWDQFHSPKNLSMALSVECAELVEIFQWLTEEQSYILDEKKTEHVREEIADIAVYLIMICSKLNIDLEDAILEKIKKNEAKYTIDEFKGSSKKYSET